MCKHTDFLSIMSSLNYLSTGVGKIKIFNMQILASLLKSKFDLREWRNNLNREKGEGKMVSSLKFLNNLEKIKWRKPLPEI